MNDSANITRIKAVYNALDELADFIACYNPMNRNKRTATWSQENKE